MGIFNMLRPSVIIRRKAIWSGLLGNSGPWRAVAMVLIGREILKKLSGSGSETIDIASFGAGRNMEIVTSKPLSRKKARKLAKQGRLMPLREQRAAATLWARKRVAERPPRRRFGVRSQSKK